MTSFVPGLELSEHFYWEAVKAVLDTHFPTIEHSAALIGPGSEVLGYDTPQSTDHHWGPRMFLYLSEEVYPSAHADISEILSRELPYTFRGYPTSFSPPDEVGVRHLQPATLGAVRHMVELTTVPAFFRGYLGIDPQEELGLTGWLTLPEHRLLASTRGKVFHDGLGTLTPIREKLAYYPHEIWLYLLASQWQLVAQEEAFVGRAGDVGDELGSRLIATRIVRYLMRLCFLMERTYVLYSKWFGTAFSRLDYAPVLAPVLEGVLSAESWRARERQLSRAYELVAQQHNALQITAPLDTTVSLYYGRPYQVINAERFVEQIREAITDESVRKLPLIGSIDQFVESADLLEDLGLAKRLRAIY